MPSLTIASWNIQALRGAKDVKLQRVADALDRHDPDVVVLQEVSNVGDVAERLRERLSAVGLTCWTFSGSAERRQTKYGDKMHGNVIASRRHLTPQSWPVEMQYDPGSDPREDLRPRLRGAQRGHPQPSAAPPALPFRSLPWPHGSK